MRIVRVTRWPNPPVWVVGIVVGYLALVGTSVLLSSMKHRDLVLCHFRLLTDYPCPACGTTRMVMAALRGDPGAAFGYNPFMAILLLAVFVTLLIRVTCKRKIVWITRQRDTARWTVAFVVALFVNWCYVLFYHGAF